MQSDELQTKVDRLREQIGAVVLGQDRAVELLFAALLAGGHVLIEGMPGTAKTMLAQMFAAGLALDFKRVQFTPDLMPGDITGTNLFHFESNEFRLIRGPVFTDLLLADEINRAPPKTQSALLQAMQERSVTIDGKTHDLGERFMVVATQNPIEQEGTYPLPEAQLDRFLVKIDVTYPEREAEIAMARMHGHRAGNPEPGEVGIQPLGDREWLSAARAHVAEVELAEELLAYVVDLVRATREHASLSIGASPRSINMMCLTARAIAALRGRSYVVPDDVQELIGPVLGHRVVLSPGAELEGTRVESLMEQVLEQVAVPR